MQQPTLNWRKQYVYTCKECGKKRTTVREDKAEDKVCKMCISARVPENQTAMAI